MRKTINLTLEEIDRVNKYQEDNGLKTFSAAMKGIIRDMGKCTCVSDDIPDDKFALIADAIMKMDEKLESMRLHIAPRSAGEVKP